MAGSIYDWSLVPGDNDTADGDINWQEGQFPDTVNNSARTMMTRLAEWLKDQGVLTATGTADAISVTANSAFTAYATGIRLSFKANAANTGAVTLNANGLGGKGVRKVDKSGGGDTPLSAGDIQTSGIYNVVYDAAANSGAGAWILLDATEGVDITTTDNAIARFDGTSGQLQNSDVTIDDSNNVSAAGYVHGSSGGGSAEAVRIGNDASLWDVGTANTANLRGLSQASEGFLTFGSGSAAFVGTSGATEVIIGHNAGQITMRPNGRGNATGQATLLSNGTFSATAFSGDGSGLSNVTAANSDLLDGQDWTFFRNASNLNAGTISSSLLPTDVWKDSDPPAANTLWSAINGATGGITFFPSGAAFQIGKHNGVVIQFYDGGGNFYGNIANDSSSNRTNYNQTSDYRVKKDISDLKGSGAFIDSLRPREFTLTNSGVRNAGFIAHEFAKTAPYAVTGEKDAVGEDGKPILQAMQASAPEVIANIVAELQSLRRRVDALEDSGEG